MSLLWKYFKRFLRFKRPLFAGFACVALAQLMDVLVTVMIGNAITDLVAGGNSDFMPRLIMLLLAYAVGHSIFRFFQRWLIVVVSRRFEVQLKQELFDKLTSLPFSFHNKSRSGDVVSRLTSDVENLRMFLGPGLMYTLGAMVIVPFSLWVLFQINPWIAGAMILPMLLMAIAMKAFTPTLHKHSTSVQESLADISHRAQENFAGIRIVKGYSREDQQAERFGATSEENRHNQVLLAHSRGLTHAAVNGAFDLTFVVILLIGGLAAIDHTLAIGDLFKFIDLTIKVFWPLIALGWIAGMYPRAMASAERVTELLDQESDIQSPPQPVVLPKVRGELELAGVGFTYEGASESALTGINVKVPAGTTLGVVGPTGCGKTTMLNLLGRLFEAEGTIALDGVPVADLALDQLRSTLGYVPQDSFLFSEPYEANIRFGADEEIGDDDVAHLIERASMTEEVANFPDGVNQLIGERGVTLSGGQRQRTCIARALARDPRVLILDDCLSAVDTETEKELLGNLREDGVGRTVVVAAHRLSTVKSAEQILVLTADGKVECLGTHKELLEREGWYRRTWRQQQELEELSDL